MRRRYDIIVAGRLDSNWSDWFDGVAIQPYDDGTSLLSGVVVDQAALHGLLGRIRDLGLPLLTVTSEECDMPSKKYDE